VLRLAETEVVLGVYGGPALPSRLQSMPGQTGISAAGGPRADPTELYLEASWALAASGAPHDGAGGPFTAARDPKEFRELRAALARRRPAALTPEELVEQIMGVEDPDLDALAWRLFAGMLARTAEEGGLPGPGIVRLEAAKVFDGVVARLEDYPALATVVSQVKDLGPRIAQDRSVHEIRDSTRAHLERLSEIVRSRVSPGISRRINEAVNLVREDLRSDVSLQAVARRLMVSSGHLSREFSRQMSESFSHFRQRARIERAKELLRDHRARVYEVAEQIGFTNVTHFTKVFVKLTGMTPSEYRDAVDRPADKP
ncbi:MAG TPA: AraC family transcriptional regulator, partial [Spirochaetia bacterium]|nr:AraC family transcriptional regulator [Spirochaetia bacterium]